MTAPTAAADLEKFNRMFAHVMGQVEDAQRKGEVRAIVICVMNESGESETFHAIMPAQEVFMLGALNMARYQLEHYIGGQFVIGKGGPA